MSIINQERQIFIIKNDEPYNSIQSEPELEHFKRSRIS
jgi:hypothetical protein